MEMFTTLDTKMSSDEEENNIQVLQFQIENQIHNNNYLLNAFIAYKRKNFSESIQFHQEFMEFHKENEIEKLIIQTNIAIIHFKNCEFFKSIKKLEEILIQSKTIKTSNLEKKLMITIKIMVLL